MPRIQRSRLVKLTFSKVEPHLMFVRFETEGTSIINASRMSASCQVRPLEQCNKITPDSSPDQISRIRCLFSEIFFQDSMSSKVFSDINVCKSFLESTILQTRNCNSCNTSMKIKTRQERQATIVYECTRCHKRQNILALTIFKSSDFNNPTFLKKIWCFVNKVANKDINNNLRLTQRTWIRFKNKLIKEVLIPLNRQQQQQIDGPGHTIQVDETYLWNRRSRIRCPTSTIRR